MKRILFAIAGYALYRWLTKPSSDADNGEIVGILPPPRRNAPQPKPAAPA
jgi:hypothetical protein